MNDFTSSGPMLADALAHHEAGRLTEAEALYRSVLERHPEDSNAWHLLGVLQVTSVKVVEIGRWSGASSIRPPLLRGAV